MRAATGSRPYGPEDVDFSHPAVFDSDTILTMPRTPRRLLIYGAGVIGCEYASILSALGVKVDLINTREQLLSYLDEEISDALSYHLRTQGAVIRHAEEYGHLEYSDGGVTLHLKSGKRLQGEALLWCNGRTGNTTRLGLHTIGLEPDSRGQLAARSTRATSTTRRIQLSDDGRGLPHRGAERPEPPHALLRARFRAAPRRARAAA